MDAKLIRVEGQWFNPRQLLTPGYTFQTKEIPIFQYTLNPNLKLPHLRSYGSDLDNFNMPMHFI